MVFEMENVGVFYLTRKEAPQLNEKRHEKGRRKPDFPGNCGENLACSALHKVIGSDSRLDRTAI